MSGLDRVTVWSMFTPRHTLTTAALAAVAVAMPATALASSPATQKLSSLTAPSKVPASIHGAGGPALLKSGQKIKSNQTVLRYKLDLKPKVKKTLTIACPSGKVVRGYGLANGKGEFGIDGHDFAGKRVVHPKLGASNASGKGLSGTMLVLCS